VDDIDGADVTKLKSSSGRDVVGEGGALDVGGAGDVC